MTEKILPALLLLYGCWVFLITADGISFYVTYAETGHSYLRTALLYHLNVLLSLLAIISGILTFRRSAFGWIGSIGAWSFLSLHLLAGVIRNGIKGCIDPTSAHTLLNMGVIVLGFGFSTYVFRDFRQRYQPSAKHLRISILVALIFILDEIALLLYTT